MSNNEISVPPAEQIDEAGDWMGPVQSVPPAGGEPEVLGRMQGCYITPLQSIPDGTELVDRAHVTRLQTEVETLRTALRTEVEAGDSWKREAQDLREELDALKAKPQGEPVAPFGYWLAPKNNPGLGRFHRVTPEDAIVDSQSVVDYFDITALYASPPAPVADEDWHMNPCKQGHRDVGAAGGVASCYQCDEKIAAATTQEAFRLWNAAHPKP